MYSPPVVGLSLFFAGHPNWCFSSRTDSPPTPGFFHSRPVFPALLLVLSCETQSSPLSLTHPLFIWAVLLPGLHRQLILDFIFPAVTGFFASVTDAGGDQFPSFFYFTQELWLKFHRTPLRCSSLGGVFCFFFFFFFCGGCWRILLAALTLDFLTADLKTLHGLFSSFGAVNKDL